MKRFLFSLALSITFISLYANQENHALDSVMNMMKDRSIPFMERYYNTAHIHVFPYEQQVDILKLLLPEAKKQEDKAIITRMYSVIANTYINLEKYDITKNYLDSAFQYKGQFDNNAILGVLHFTLGSYYQNMNDVKLAHENYYEAVEYLQKLPARPALLSSIYFNLASIYVLWEDEQRLKELVDEIKEIPIVHSQQIMMSNWVIGEYYNVQFRKSNDIALLDSTIKYNELAIALSDTSESAATFHQLSQNYIRLAQSYTQKGDIEAARKNLELAEQHTKKDSWSHMMLLNVAKGKFYASTKDYSQAEEALYAALELLNRLKKEQKADYYHFNIEICDRLGQIYEEQKMYEKALVYEKESLEYRQQLFNKENSQIVQDLRTQYNLEQQERIVNQLTLLSERRKNINILAVVILVLFLILIIQLIVRFRITKRANENKLKIEQMKRKEGELQIELYKSREEEKDHEFKIMQTEVQQRRMQSYLEGLETARERLSKELHDNISNELMALKMRILQSEKPEDIVERLSLLQAEVRAISHDLMPPIFQHALFTEVLYEYVSQWNELSETQLLLTFDPEDESWDELPEEINLGLYRIIQEAVGNTLKHAKATQIDILLSRSADKITLTIQDNGKGFETEGEHRGIGMKLIKERAKGLNGEAFINSTPGKGTKIEVVIANV